MDDKLLFEGVDMDDCMVYVPLGETAIFVEGVLVVDREASDLIARLDEGMTQGELIGLLCSLCEDANEDAVAKKVKMDSTELEIIRDLCEKARTGNCSQYTYQNLMNRLSTIL